VPVECHVCHTPTRIVYYRSFTKYPKSVRTLRWLVLIAACISAYNVGHFMFKMGPWFGANEKIQDFINTNAGDDEIGYFLRDFGTFFSNVLTYMILVLLAALVYLPTQYAIILLRFRKGHPRTYWLIRRTAIITFLVNAGAWFTFFYLFSGVETLYVAPPVGLNLIVAPVVFAWTRNPLVREYFSQFKWQALPPVAPRVVGVAVVEQVVASSWMPVDAPVKTWEAADVDASASTHPQQRL
jgi:hypothetical protein